MDLGQIGGIRGKLVELLKSQWRFLWQITGIPWIPWFREKTRGSGGLGEFGVSNVSSLKDRVGRAILFFLKSL